MNILITTPVGMMRDSFITSEVIENLSKLGNLHWNETSSDYTSEKLSEVIKDIDFLFGTWGNPKITKQVVENANRLKLIAYCGGSVGNLYCDELYKKEIKLSSGNELFAESVAEGTICYILCGLRQITKLDSQMKNGAFLNSGSLEQGLLDQTVGIVSLGAVSKNIISMLKPFRCKVKVYSTRIDERIANEYGFTYATLDEIFESCNVISIHTALNSNTVNMINKNLLSKMKDGAIIINTARGAVINEEDLITELKNEKISAVLDVFTIDPLPIDSELRSLDNITLIPHRAGPTFDRRKHIALAMVNEISNFIENKPLKYEISYDYAKTMTTEI